MCFICLMFSKFYFTYHSYQNILIQEVAAISKESQQDADDILQEADDSDDDFLFDNNIPSIPTHSTLDEAPTSVQRRSKLAREISKRKSYNQELLRQISDTHRNRTMLRSVSCHPHLNHNVTCRRNRISAVIIHF